MTDVCKKGHPRTPENTRVRKSGKRDCLPCDRERVQEWRRTNRERDLANKRAYRLAHLDQVRANYLANVDQRRESARKRQAVRRVESPNRSLLVFEHTVLARRRSRPSRILVRRSSSVMARIAGFAVCRWT